MEGSKIYRERGRREKINIKVSGWSRREIKWEWIQKVR